MDCISTQQYISTGISLAMLFKQGKHRGMIAWNSPISEPGSSSPGWFSAYVEVDPSEVDTVRKNCHNELTYFDLDDDWNELYYNEFPVSDVPARTGKIVLGWDYNRPRQWNIPYEMVYDDLDICLSALDAE